MSAASADARQLFRHDGQRVSYGGQNDTRTASLNTAASGNTTSVAATAMLRLGGPRAPSSAGALPNRMFIGNVVCTRASVGTSAAIGQNMLIAFMSWSGSNYEDAIILSENLVRENKFTSIHIEEFIVNVRDTKLGPEVTTPDIPNVGEAKLKNLSAAASAPAEKVAEAKEQRDAALARRDRLKETIAVLS